MLTYFFLYFSTIAVSKFQKTMGLLGNQLKSCLKEHFSLIKLAIKLVKEKTSGMKTWLINALRELEPTVKYAAEQIEMFGIKVKHYVVQILEKYMPSFLGNFGHPSRFLAEFLAAVKQDIDSFTVEARSCLEQLLTIREIESFYHAYLSWIEEIHLYDKVTEMYQQGSR